MLARAHGAFAERGDGNIFDTVHVAIDVLSYDAYVLRHSDNHPGKPPLPRELVERVSETVVTWWENRRHAMEWQFNWRRLYRRRISDCVAGGERDDDEDAVAQELAATADIAQAEGDGDMDTAQQEPATAEDAIRVLIWQALDSQCPRRPALPP